MTVPMFELYMNPMLQALVQLGGSATKQELDEMVPELMQLTDEQLAVMHDPGKSNVSEVVYRMGWARTYLKKVGLIDNSTRGIWTLTSEGRAIEGVEPEEVVRQVREQYQASRDAQVSNPDDTVEHELQEEDWRVSAMHVLRQMDPTAFERLCQRLLRECGFVEVEVTGRTGDGGIDGIGILRLQELVSLQVLFQSKRYSGSVGSPEIRDFRGAMVGRTDKGLFITTGYFTRAAQQEATRDGAPTIDLIDGDRLLDLLKRMGLGVKTEMVEKITIDEAWFAQI